MMASRKILIVDDQPSIHEAFRSVLAKPIVATDQLDALESLIFESELRSNKPLFEPFELQHASGGEEALTRVRRAAAECSPFALAFVDMRMPQGWDGVETIEHLWQVDPELQVVVCTAFSDQVWEDIVRRLRKVDQLLLLNKPFASETALSIAHALAAKRQILDELQRELANAREVNRRLAHEIAIRKDAEKSLLEMATCDSLTGLPNRAVLNRLLRDYKVRSANDSEPHAAILFLDLDNFKLVNDSFGHRAGDELLIEIAVRLRTCLAEACVPYPDLAASIHRLGGDEFVVFLTNVESQAQAINIGSEINDALKPEYSIRNRPVTISASIGITMVDCNTSDEDDVLRKADTAMYRAKSDGKNRCAVFDDEMHRRVLDQLEIEHGLRGALERNEFELHYQPIVELKGRKTVGFEALIRWRNASGRLISPDRFISFAEESRLIIPIGRWIAERACNDFAVWKHAFDDTDECSVSINVSKIQLVESKYDDELAEICAAAGLQPKDVNVEVTESTVIGSTAEVVANLDRLRARGFGIHMDDFGTGHSSLSLLHRFPIDVLKIDRSFVATMENDIEYSTIVEAIITLAKNLDIELTAEGIENERQVQLLLDLGCDHGQGYFFAKPMPAAQAFARRSQIYCATANV
ncbi:MAG: EAL domain-containing protein [Pirellulales bacterium]